LEAGADDYLPKPFSLAELKLRVKNLLTLVRDNQSWGSQVILDEIIFYPTQGIIQTPEKKLILRRRETQIMECLTNAGGALVSRHQLIRALWPPSYQPNSSTVDVYIRRLRQKLGVYHAILQTRRGFGYRVVLQRKV
jgi:DNA-binding response OmpR family regulator